MILTQKYFDAFRPTDPKVGHLILACPYLPDQFFSRTVILLCAKDKNGVLGYILNKKSPLKLQEVIQEDLVQDFPVFLGGPVQQKTLHYLHNVPSLAAESMKITTNLYWGIGFSKVFDMLRKGYLSEDRIRFFAGFANWDHIQFQGELGERSWITQSDATQYELFSYPIEKMWRNILSEMQPPFKYFANFPDNPSHN